MLYLLVSSYQRAFLQSTNHFFHHHLLRNKLSCVKSRRRCFTKIWKTMKCVEQNSIRNCLEEKCYIFIGNSWEKAGSHFIKIFKILPEKNLKHLWAFYTCMDLHAAQCLLSMTSPMTSVSIVVLWLAAVLTHSFFSRKKREKSWPYEIIVLLYTSTTSYWLKILFSIVSNVKINFENRRRHGGDTSSRM